MDTLRVSICYTNGIGKNEDGTQQDYEKAFEWHLKSAKNGDAMAHNNLGDCYYFGIGAKVNIEEAIVCYKVASDNGIDKAKVRFAELD
ncbi:unnamed protein product [Rhizophagus irregularis]|nr:unnamed protein product [Rhizophagus irregularis]